MIRSIGPKGEHDMTVVDVHCHTFNADDLPVKGFVKRVVGNRRALVRAIGWSLDKVVQDMSSGAEENEELDRLLMSGPGSFEADEEPVMTQVEVEADMMLEELEREDPALAEEAGQEAARDPGSHTDEGGEPGEEGILDTLGDLRRYMKWAALFGKDRLALTRALIDLYQEVDLFTPMLVDFQGLEDTPKTTVLEQLELQEKISRLGVLGHLDAQVLPFVGFDPRRLGALPVVREAVRSYGCVGVKMYPPMGFLPFGNRDHPPYRMSHEDALGVDAALAEMYDWCSAEQVPITAHSNASNYADDSFRDHSQPANWQRVLERWPDLHLNLGHFGWGSRDRGWPDSISELMATFAGLYADIGNHELADLEETTTELARLFDGASTGTVRERFMFGTDWFMVASHRDFEEFLHRVRSAFAARFSDDVDRFMGGAALSFLGFDDPDNANNQRMRERYQILGVERPEWLAA